MFANVKGIHFEHPGIEKHIDIDFFDEPCDVGCFVYGRNGSGKSTIARWCKNYTIDSSDYFYNHNDECIELPQELIDRIYVFDEEYIEKNINVESDGVNTIVILGKSVEVDQKLNKVQKIISKLRKRESKIKECIDNLDSEKLRLENSIKDTIKTNWGEREKKITNNQRRPNVNEQVISQIKSVDNDIETVDIILEKFEKQLLELKQLSSLHGKFDILDIILPQFSEDELYKLLDQNVEKQELTKREEYLLSLLDAKSDIKVSSIENTFLDEHTIECPFCMQPVSSDYKADICNSIKRILTKEVEQFQDKLRAISLEAVELDLTAYSTLDNDLKGEIETSIKTLNSKLIELDKHKQAKILNPYESIDYKKVDLLSVIGTLKLEINAFNKMISLVNKNFDNKESLKSDLQILNKKIARKEINEFLFKHKETEIELVKLENIQQNNSNRKGILEAYKNSLEITLANTKIAVDTINHWLYEIFFDKNRMIIEEHDNKYILKVNSKTVAPKNISTGERNIIALCYFLTSLGENLPESERYKACKLVVFDDPISSFDLNNKLGMLSFLKNEIKLILKESDYKSRVIMLSHDLQTMYDFEKFFKRSFDGYKVKFKEFGESVLKSAKFDKRYEYSSLLKDIYRFSSDDTCEDFKVGNTLRRVLEYYSTFLYRKGIDALIAEDEFLNRIENQKRRAQFERFLSTLVMNGYSHSQEIAQNHILMQEPLFSVEECRKHTRLLICFLYELDNKHVISNLLDAENPVLTQQSIETTINSWLSELIVI